MIKQLELFTTYQQTAWQAVLQQTTHYDFYHLPSYHAMPQSEGEPVLLVYREGNLVAALPLIIRAIATVAGLEGCPYKDATSVYGYPGPLVNEAGLRDPAFLARFHQALTSFAVEQNLVAIFSRLHPLLENHHCLQGIGAITPLSNTVSVDLTLDTETQLAHYRKSHRYEVRRARRAGLQVYRDQSWHAYEKFIELYTQTMRRVNAAVHYFFDRSFFTELKDALGDQMQLFVAEMDNQICAAALFVRTGNIVQYHLSGSDDNYLKWAPSKVIIDEARQWGSEIGAHTLHLGGGVGSSNDSLFELKAGFSPRQHTFYVWRWQAQPQIYDELVAARTHWLKQHDKAISAQNYFPLYRA